MSRPFRLASVLRARQAQEDAARSAAAQAREAAAAAEQAALRQETDLYARDIPSAGPAKAVIAALVARRAMTGDLAVALHIADQARQEADDRAGELAEAATRRRTVERLAERQADQEARDEQAADQRVIDELAITDRQRASVREVRS